MTPRVSRRAAENSPTDRSRSREISVFSVSPKSYDFAYRKSCSAARPKASHWFRAYAVGALVSFFLVPFSLHADESDAAPVPLIFDTDIGNDVDDVLALGMIHALQSRGECKLLAVTITKDHPLAASFTDAVNTFYGRGNVPIGVCRSKVTPAEGKFIGLGAKQDDGELRYPHDLLSGDDAPHATTVLRKALADAQDHSVVFVQVGFSTNLATLLDSKPDAISPLNGRELVAKKARLLSIMAGVFNQGQNGKLKNHKEYNVVKDIPSAQTLADRWPTEIIWSGFEIGVSLTYPHQSIEQDYGYTKHHPLEDAYRLYMPPPHDRPTWDLTSVLIAVRPHRGYFGFSEAGTVTVADDAATTFRPVKGGSQRYLTLTEHQRVRVLEALVQLSSQPPQTIAGHANR
jgi:purine nucleosidase